MNASQDAELEHIHTVWDARSSEVVRPRPDGELFSDVRYVHGKSTFNMRHNDACLPSACLREGGEAPRRAENTVVRRVLCRTFASACASFRARERGASIARERRRCIDRVRTNERTRCVDARARERVRSVIGLGFFF